MLEGAPLEYLLEHIVAELILNQTFRVFNYYIEHCVLGLDIVRLEDVLHSAGAVLIPGPLAHLVQVVQQLLLGRHCVLVVVERVRARRLVVGHQGRVAAHPELLVRYLRNPVGGLKS